MIGSWKTLKFVKSCCRQCLQRRTESKRLKALSPSFFARPLSTESQILQLNKELEERAKPQIKLPENFRCSKDDPFDHGLEDVGKFYNIPSEYFQLLCPEKGNKKGFIKHHLQEFDAFQEYAIMIREPALEILSYLKQADYSNLVQRYLLYGDPGTGKSISLQHITHALLKHGWLVVPTMYAWDWVTYKRAFVIARREEVIASQWNNTRLDQPVRATAWLENFRIINKHFLDKIFTTREYIWTKREKTEVGTSFSALVDHGIARARISTDVIGCIMWELRNQPPEKLPRVLVTVDSINGLFGGTKLRSEFAKVEDPNALSFVYNLKKMLNCTWKNGAVVMATTGDLSNDPTKVEGSSDVENTYERLGKEAFDLLDPHVPVLVPQYTDKELLHHLAYYRDRKWLTGQALTDTGTKEIIQLACYNPHQLSQLCGSLF